MELKGRPRQADLKGPSVMRIVMYLQQSKLFLKVLLTCLIFVCLQSLIVKFDLFAISPTFLHMQSPELQNSVSLYYKLGL